MLTNRQVRYLTKDFLESTVAKARRRMHVTAVLAKYGVSKVAALSDDQLQPFVLDLADFYKHEEWLFIDPQVGDSQ